jgi:hypothetical protein
MCISHSTIHPHTVRHQVQLSRQRVLTRVIRKCINSLDGEGRHVAGHGSKGLGVRNADSYSLNPLYPRTAFCVGLASPGRDSRGSDSGNPRQKSGQMAQ